MATLLPEQNEALDILKERVGNDLRDFVIMRNEEQNQDNILAIGYTMAEFCQYIHWSAFEKFNEKPNVHNAMVLFWDVYEWWKSEDGSLPASLSDSTEEYEGLVLAVLDSLYKCRKVPYIPDTDDSGRYNELLIYLHIIAARAFRIRKNNGLSEEAIDCFIEILSTYARIRSTSAWKSYAHLGNKHPKYISTHAIVAISFREISRIDLAQGSNMQALSNLWEAVLYYEDALEYAQIIDLSNDVDDKGDGYDWNARFQKLLTGLDVSLEEAADIFYALRSKNESVEDWKGIVRACDGLSYVRTDAVTGYSDVIDDPDSEYGAMEIGWIEFWYSARAWASAQMSRSEFWEWREQEEARAAENRLKNYFFDDTWLDVPPRARKALISADREYNSREAGRLESILNELYIAIEETCLKFIWRPLEDDRTPSGFDFLNIQAKLAENPQLSSPDMSHYEYDICKRPFFREFLERQGLGNEDIGFLTESLPNSMSQLRKERNSAQHDSGYSRTRDDIGSFYRGFLGIGQAGVLPELIRVGRKLSSR